MNYISRSAHVIRQAGTHVSGFAALRPEDVLLVSYPRSGSSWLRAVLANLVFIDEGRDRLVAPANLDEIMPSLGYSNLQRAWCHELLPRFVKTHRSFLPLLMRVPKRSVLLVRDPRDVMVSYFNYAQFNLVRPFSGDFSEFLRDRTFGLRRCLSHYRSWASHVTCMVRYESARAYPVYEIGRLLEQLDIDIPSGILDKAIEKSTFDRMKALEVGGGVRDPGRFRPGFRAVRSAASGQWQNTFSASDLAYFHSLTRELRVPVPLEGGD